MMHKYIYTNVSSIKSTNISPMYAPMRKPLYALMYAQILSAMSALMHAPMVTLPRLYEHLQYPAPILTAY